MLVPSDITYESVTTQRIIVPLAPTVPEAAALEATIEAFEHARKHAVAVGQQAGTTSHAVIQRLCYHELRRIYGLNANLAIRVIACAARHLKGMNPEENTLIEYDARTLSFRNQGRHVSLSTVEGRLKHVTPRLCASKRRALATGRLVRAILHRRDEDPYVLVVTLTTASQHADEAPARSRDS